MEMTLTLTILAIAIILFATEWIRMDLVSLMVLLAVAILPFAVRNSEIVRQIAAMCGFTLN